MALETLILSEFHQKTREKCGQKLAKKGCEKREEDCERRRKKLKRDVKRNCLDQVTQEKEMESEKIAGINFAELKIIKM